MFFLSTVDRNGSPQAMLGTNMAGDSASMPVGALRLRGFKARNPRHPGDAASFRPSHGPGVHADGAVP